MNVIFQSTYYTLYQAANERCFYVDFGQKQFVCRCASYLLYAIK